MRLVPRGGDIELLVRVMLLARLYWPLILGFFLVSMLATPLTLLTPIPLKIVADALVGEEALPGLLSPLVPSELESSETRLIALAAILFVLVTLLRQTQELSRMLLYTFIGERLTLEFRSRLFGQVQRMSLAYHDSQGTADSVYRIQYDATAVQNLAIEGVIPFVASSVTLIAMIYVIFAIDWQLAIAACAAAPVMLVLARMYQTRLRQQARSVKRLESSAMEVIQEVLGSLRVVKAFGQEEREGERFYERAEDSFQSRVGLSAMEGFFGLLIGLTTAGAGAVVLYIGATHVRSGVLTLGELLLVMGYLTQLYEPLKSASRRVGKMQSSLASAERVFQLLDEAPDVEERLDALPLERARGDIRFSGVSFGYNADASVLNRASFRVQPGQRLGVCGATGAGKTTMISLLTRLYDPNDGKITLDGVDIRDYKVADLRNQFAVVLQEPVLFSTTIAENIAYARPGATFDELVEAASAANAHDFITSLPDGYDTIVGERGMRLSGGERQRVALARAFLKDAPILVLDEPTSSVDHQTEAAIVAAMKRLMACRTTIMIAHRLSTLDDCDRWLELLPGGKTRLIKEPPSGATRQRDAETGSGGVSRASARSTAASSRKSTRRGAGEPTRVPRRVLSSPARAAAIAWQRTSGVKLASIHVETLKSNAESAVYLLRSAVSDDLNVVAKHCPRPAGLKESFIYNQILSRVPGRGLACRGLWDDHEDHMCWLFLEEARGKAFDSQNPEHLTAGAYWLSSLHRYAKVDNLALRLPERDIAYYLELVDVACQTIEKNIENPAINGRYRATLEDTLRRCAALAGQERELKRIAALVPATLVHGSLKPANVRVMTGGANAAFIAFDWAGAGWGTPAIDLSRIDLVTYRHEAERLGLESDPQDLRAVSALGRALWAASQIPAELSSLAQLSADKKVSKLSDYRGKMASLAETTGWTA